MDMNFTWLTKMLLSVPLNACQAQSAEAHMYLLDNWSSCHFFSAHTVPCHPSSPHLLPKAPGKHLVRVQDGLRTGVSIFPLCCAPLSIQACSSVSLTATQHLKFCFLLTKPPLGAWSHFSVLIGPVGYKEPVLGLVWAGRPAWQRAAGTTSALFSLQSVSCVDSAGAPDMVHGVITQSQACPGLSR